jgi:N-acetylmuramoyl-L-alanine amidase
MPAVLVETAFISNNMEEQEMETPGFRDKIADGIAKGIEEYFAKIQ